MSRVVHSKNVNEMHRNVNEMRGSIKKRWAGYHRNGRQHEEEAGLIDTDLDTRHCRHPWK